MEQRQHPLERLQQELAAGGTAGLTQGRQFTAQQVGDHLGVGLREKHHPFGLQLLAQAAEVLDDAVLHHRHLAGTIQVGMGIAFLRFAVGGPTGVADAAEPPGPLLLVAAGEVDQLALGPQASELTPGHGGQAGGVVAAVLQLTQALKQQRSRLAGTDHRDDAAHGGRG